MPFSIFSCLYEAAYVWSLDIVVCPYAGKGEGSWTYTNMRQTFSAGLSHSHDRHAEHDVGTAEHVPWQKIFVTFSKTVLKYGNLEKCIWLPQHAQEDVFAE